MSFGFTLGEPSAGWWGRWGGRDSPSLNAFQSYDNSIRSNAFICESSLRLTCVDGDSTLILFFIQIGKCVDNQSGQLPSTNVVSVMLC